MPTGWTDAFIGGALIGLAVSLMLFWNGRVTGISGIINGALSSWRRDNLWRVFFILGLLAGGLMLKGVRPDFFINTLGNSNKTILLAGLLVGFGTVMGSGCTSGHGVCGVSRLSPRSLVATAVFMLAGVAAVSLFKKWGVYL